MSHRRLLWLDLGDNSAAANRLYEDRCNSVYLWRHTSDICGRYTLSHTYRFNPPPTLNLMYSRRKGIVWAALLQIFVISTNVKVYVSSELCPFQTVVSDVLSPQSRPNPLGELAEVYSTSKTSTTIQRPGIVAFRVPGHDVSNATAGRLLVVAEHALMATGLQLALSQRRWHVETNDAATADDLVDHARRFQPHCVLLDTQLRNGMGGGIALIEPLRQSGAHIVMLTAERRRTVLAECLEAGAVGWIRVQTPLEEVNSTLERVLSGWAIVGRTERAELLEHLRLERARSTQARATFEQLTHREALVLAALADGLSADEIARAHFVALTTVRSQIRAVLQKLGVRSQLAAVALADTHRELLPYGSSAARDRRRTARVDHSSAPALAGRSA